MRSHKYKLSIKKFFSVLSAHWNWNFISWNINTTLLNSANNVDSKSSRAFTEMALWLDESEQAIRWGAFKVLWFCGTIRRETVIKWVRNYSRIRPYCKALTIYQAVRHCSLIKSHCLVAILPLNQYYMIIQMIIF